MTGRLSTVMREGECPSRCLIHESLDIHLFFLVFILI